MTRIEPLAVDGALLIHGPVHADERGWFRKPFQESVLAEAGLHSHYREQFFSWSHRDVIRGLHLQTPPHEQWKLVTCLSGTVWDVVLDVRADSPTRGRHVGVELSGDVGTSVLMPPGCAHGFLTLSDEALVGYWVSAEYAAASDTGVRWDSAGIEWPTAAEPIVSARDRALAAVTDFPPVQGSADR